MNVRDSDGTLVLNLGELAGGTLLTTEEARRQGRPLKVVQLDAGVSEELVRDVRAWLVEHGIEVLNVAGPRESQRVGIYGLALDFLGRLRSA